MAGYVYRGSNPSESSKSVGRPSQFKPELCGTTAGYMQHYRRKEERCEPCLEARRIYDAEYQAQKKAARELLRPQQSTPKNVWETNNAAGKIDSDGPNKTAPDVLSTRTPGPDH